MPARQHPGQFRRRLRHRRDHRPDRDGRAILDGLVAAKTCRETCQELGISRSLYHYHLHAMRRYFRVRTTVEAVLAYVRQKVTLEGSPTP